MPAAPPPETFDRLMLSIGRLNYFWSNTESLLIHLIAGLSGVDKEVAVILFLTLNTTRARVDLVERLAKLDRVPEERRERLLALTREFLQLSALRNRYSHSIYAFNGQGAPRTIQMRIADRRHDIRLGRTEPLDEDALAALEDTLSALATLNRKVWKTIHDLGYPV